MMWRRWRVLSHTAADRNITIGCWQYFGGKTEAVATRSKILTRTRLDTVPVMVALVACELRFAYRDESVMRIIMWVSDMLLGVNFGSDLVALLWCSLALDHVVVAVDVVVPSHIMLACHQIIGQREGTWE